MCVINPRMITLQQFCNVTLFLATAFIISDYLPPGVCIFIVKGKALGKVV